MKIHEIIGTLLAFGMLLTILLLIWTNIDWKLLLKTFLTCFIFLRLLVYYDDYYNDTNNN